MSDDYFGIIDDDDDDDDYFGILDDDDDERDSRRTIGIRDKQILYRKAKGTCENPGCNKKIDFDEMQVGHKTAWSRNGSTTFKNSVCLCYRCNKLQGTDSWVVFMKKQGVESPETKAKQEKAQIKKELASLTLQQLKLLASKHKVKVSGSVKEGFSLFGLSLTSDQTFAPTKQQYINKLSGILTIKDLRSAPEEAPNPKKKSKTITRSTKK